TRLPQLLEVVAVAQRVHRMPEAAVLICPQLVVFGHANEWFRFPGSVVALNVIESGLLQDEKSAVDPGAVTVRLFLKPDHSRVFDEHRTIPARGLYRGKRPHTAMPTVEAQQVGHIEIRKTVPVSEAERIAIEIGTHSFQAPTG